ncbi:MAG: CDP-diacylglycerol--glycerol-3-phosphate 3-phosphatidyltransferase [Rhodospirillaceae bacterium]|nr:CDP-diacylglycerol--glycerol-3-phosphate 3-phosphatidyltransferase [Rhodospirillaceae bacterium]
MTNLPNILTFGRIAAVPLLIAVFYLPAPAANWAALAVFAAASITDFVDGWLARRWQVESDLGKVLDPIADKLLVAAALFMLAAFDRLSIPSIVAAIAILGREILVSGLREFLAGRATLPVTLLAKWKTTVQMVALAVLLLGPAAPWGVPAQSIGEAGLWLAAIMTLITGWDYFRRGLDFMSRTKPGAAR